MGQSLDRKYTEKWGICEGNFTTMKFSVKAFFSKCEQMWAVSCRFGNHFTEETLHGKLHFFALRLNSRSKPYVFCWNTLNHGDLSQVWTVLSIFQLLLLRNEKFLSNVCFKKSEHRVQTANSSNKFTSQAL